MSTRNPSIHHRGRLSLVAASIGLAGFTALSLAFLGSAASNYASPRFEIGKRGQSAYPLENKPELVLLGTLAAGQHAEATITLLNPSRDAVQIDRVETSCPCLSAEPTKFKVGPGESAEVRLAFDPSQEPDFRGGLSIEVIGYGAMAKIAFRTRVNLDVHAEASGARRSD